MSLSQVFASFSSFSYSSSSSQVSVRSESARSDKQSVAEDAGQTEKRAPKIPSDDVYVSSQTYRFEASYSVYTNKTEAPSVTDEGRTEAANTILSFIGNRLALDQAEGATDEALSSRLSAGLEGFIRGYQEAYEQLSALDFLNDDVESAIELTYSNVLDGVEAIAEDLGISSPVTDELEAQQASRRAEYEAPEVEDVAVTPPAREREGAANANNESGRIETAIRQAGSINEKAENLRSLIQASTYNYQQQDTRSFNFSLTTQDGDKVRIRAAYDTVSLFNGQSVAYTGGEVSELSGSFRASSGFYLDVRGELDEEEFLAIEELLGKVKQVSDTFFSGEYEKAFEYALELGFDESEIVEFSLHLRYQSSVRVEEKYQQFLSDNQPSKAVTLDQKDPRLALIADFVQALEALRLQAKELGISGFADVEASEEQVEEPGRRSSVGVVSNLLAMLEQAEQVQKALV